MATASPATASPTALSPSVLPRDWTLADVLDHLHVPPQRILAYPPLGTATEDDVLEIKRRTGRLCELVDGILVEKPMGYYESTLAVALGYFLHRYLDQRPIGAVSAPDGTMKIVPPKVRMPDVAFVRWDRLPERRLPRGRPVPVLAPDLAVEVLSETNTEEEMQQKLQEYFAGGTRLVWYIDPETRSARVFTSPDRHTVLDAQGVLDGADVLPGFQLRLGDLFDRAEKGAGEPREK